MNIKTFRASSLSEGLDRVRKEFGDQAKILHTREVDERKFFGLRRCHVVEITAAEDVVETIPDRPAVLGPEVGSFSSPPLVGDAFLDRLRTSPYEFDLSSTPSPETDRKTTPVPLGKWSCMRPEELNPTLLQQNLIRIFQERICFGGPIDLTPGRRKLVAFLGSTGVGKTSTIAKIAAHYQLKESKKVGFLSMDVYRIAALEQLRQYADTLDAPFETVSEPARIPAALKRLADCDLVLFDTPGFNPKNATKRQLLGSTLDAAKPDEIQLLLPATAGVGVLLDTLRRFESLKPTCLSLTKLDEAVGLAELYQLLKENRLPLRFLTLGQNISEDIEVAGPARLASLA